MSRLCASDTEGIVSADFHRRNAVEHDLRLIFAMTHASLTDAANPGQKPRGDKADTHT